MLQASQPPGLQASHPTGRRTRLTLIGVAAMSAAVIASLPPLTQDAGYHVFADTRRLGGWPHAANVLSNLVFLAVGLAGLRASLRREPLPARPAWIVTFAGIALVAAGSAWYHLAPSNATLVWDRLPMTVGFMGLTTAILAGPFGPAVSRALLAPAVVAGIASVAIWQLTGDLRPYVWIQFTPLLLIAVALVLSPMPRPHRTMLLAALLLYLAAKGFELADQQIWIATAGAVSGHTLKHLTAGAACAALIRLTRPAGELTARS